MFTSRTPTQFPSVKLLSFPKSRSTAVPTVQPIRTTTRFTEGGFGSRPKPDPFWVGPLCSAGRGGLFALDGLGSRGEWMEGVVVSSGCLHLEVECCKSVEERILLFFPTRYMFPLT